MILVVASLIIIRGIVGWKCPNCWNCYRTILLTWRIVLLANCPHEAKCVNIQVVPCNTVPSGWTVSVRHTLFIAAVLGIVLWTPLCHDVLPCGSYHYRKV